jgi:putative spermidine/putrescine transport system substrate-binding protein
MCIPKGVPNDRLAVTLDIMAHILKPEMQAISYDDGYLYPGPAVKNVPLSLAPKRSQDVIREFGRPEYAALIANNPIELPLDTTRMVQAFKLWDQKVGTKPAK